MTGTSGVSSPEDVCNQALDRVGYPQAIASLYEGSLAARIGLREYAATRDKLLKSHNWGFAKRETVLTLTGRAAPQPWPYEYVWPADCLRIRYVQPTLGNAYPIDDPQPVLFDDFNDPNATPSRVIVATEANAYLIYTAQIVDVTTWDPNFTEAMVDMLALIYAGSFQKSPQDVQLAGQIAAEAIATALDAQTNQAPDTNRGEARK